MCDGCFFLEENMKFTRGYFTRTELVLWFGSMLLITAASILSGGSGLLSTAASLTGAASLILAAKGNPLAQVLMIAFSAMYGIISYSFAYYGKMITYLGMTLPMAVISLISWLRHPSGGRGAEVRVNRISLRETLFMASLTLFVTVLFFFILRRFNTANLIPSTISVATSFAAAYLTFRRTIYFPLAYAANDAVLIVLWTLASISDRSYLSVLMCFVVFLANDLYGFFSWRKMQRRQETRAMSKCSAQVS